MGPISYALELIKNSPNLSKLEISVCSTSDNPEAILKYLDRPSCLKRPLDCLEYVAINDFIQTPNIQLAVSTIFNQRNNNIDGKRVAVEDDSEDTISGLPRNVINHILELLPVQDAARTSILSLNWRYIWAMLPKLVLNGCFRCNFIGKLQSDFREAVDRILLLHMGDITKFVLDTRGVFTAYSSYATIDRWIRYVT